MNSGLEGVHLSDRELASFFLNQSSQKTPTLDDRVHAMLRHQYDSRVGYPLLVKNYRGLPEPTEIYLDGVPFHVMLIESRTVSTDSTTFDKSTNNNPRIINLENLEEGRRGIIIHDGKYIILANPYPTKGGDITIVETKDNGIYKPQLMGDSYQDMLLMAKHMPSFSISFNNAYSGASVLNKHFQGSLKYVLIGERLINNLLLGKKVDNMELETIVSEKHLTLYGVIYGMQEPLQATNIFISRDAMAMNDFFIFYSDVVAQVDREYLRRTDLGFRDRAIPLHVPEFGEFIPAIGETETEPRMNLSTYYDTNTGNFVTIAFPKVYNRPRIHQEGKIKVGLSIKEALHTLILVREEDFEYVLEHPEVIKGMYKDVSITPRMHSGLNARLRNISTSRIWLLIQVVCKN